jgi:hypothetical protein
VVAEAAEVPTVHVQANAPGWITVSYRHSGADGVAAYKIARVGGASVFLDASDGQWTDAGLKPNTIHSYIVCAIYEDGEEACTEPVSATTMSLPGAPANYAPPSIVNVGVSTDAIKVTWGATGTYATILVHLSDPEGHVDQRQVKNVANGSYTFPGLRSNVRYRVILKGCSANVFTGDGCGPWSPNVFITTALPPGEAPPPAPPSNATLAVRVPDPTTVLLEFTVRVSHVGAVDKFVVYRDRKQVAEVTKLKGIVGGLGGSYTDKVGRAERRHYYHVCFLNPPSPKACSATVAGPEPSVGIQSKMPDVLGNPSGIDPGLDLHVIKKPSDIKPKPRPGTVLGR